MKLKDHRAFKRPGLLIAGGVFVITYVIMLVVGMKGDMEIEDALLLLPVISFLVSAGAFILIQVAQWIVRAPRKQEGKED